ncbi:MAG: hypothetical protein QOF98_3236, partial [Streptomyces sp.]|nr:hypothetical protein [Streptomyces sp.]
MDGVEFGNFSAAFSGAHGLRLERLPLGRPGARPERRPYRGGVAAGPAVLGREHPLGLARTAVRERGMIEFIAECGTGKTALLRQSAADAYIRVGGIGPDDLLQDLVGEFYVYPAGGRRLSSEECRRALGQVNAVVALDDVGYEPGQLVLLRRALASCAVLVGATRPVLGGLGSSYALPGLAEPAAVELLSQEVGRGIPESEMPAVRRLVAAVGGQPLHLRQAAALVRRDGHTFADLARRAESDPGVLDQLAISAAGPRAKRALAVLTLLGGALLPADLIAAMSEVTYIGAELEELFARGLAEERDDRFGLPVCKAEPYRQIFYRYLGLGASLRGLGAWLAARDPSGQDARGAAEAALGLLGFAAEQGEWAGIVRLTTVVERVLFVQGHWQAWQQALGHGVAAAQQAGDTAAEAYFSHQRGTLHFLEDRSQAAVRDLRHALDLRSALGDGPGAAVTRHNLGFAVATQTAPPRPTSLPTPPPPPPSPPTSPAPSTPPGPRDRRRRVAA